MGFLVKYCRRLQGVSRWGGGRALLLILSLILILGWSLAPFNLYAQNGGDPTFRVEPVVRNAYFPVALAFAPDGTLFYTEKETGRLRLVSPEGLLQNEPVYRVAVDSNVELGMLGVALDPTFEESGYIWIYYIQPNTVEPPYPTIKIVRLRFDFEVSAATDPLEMLSVPIVTRHQHHVGGNIRFDDEGLFYVTIGDIGEARYAQDLNAMPGRIHRFAVVDDALVPAPDNPFPNNSTYAYGLRNSFDFDFDPISGEIIASENGPQCDDEINLIFAGGNYGWRPDYPCDAANPQDASRYVYPLKYYTPTEALTGVLVYDGAMFPEWYGDVFFCAWKDGLMRRMRLDEARTSVASIEIVRLPNHSCSTDVEVSPSGAIYFTNYNAIFRIVAAENP